MKNTTARINVVDALRGFAILGILMMHSLEQFNLFDYPTVENRLLLFTDSVFNNSIPFLFAGKAYAIFALLFGLSFFIQNDNQLQKGKDFRGRFAWRLVLLFGWGVINSIFYTGDVLILFSMLGFLLIITSKLSNKAVFILAIFLFLMPLQWGKVIFYLFNAELPLEAQPHVPFYLQTLTVMKSGNFMDMVTGVVNSQLYSFLWWTCQGRIFQVAALFLLGMLIGRKGLFINTDNNIRFWGKTLMVSIICYFPLAGLLPIMEMLVENENVKQQLNIILGCYSSFAFLCILASLFVLFYYKSSFHKWLSKLEPYGKMSLTMYISQSVIGGFIFYNWGLGLAKELSVTFSILVGMGIFAIQYTFAYFWLKKHRHGPLEYIWKKATWIGAKK